MLIVPSNQKPVTDLLKISTDHEHWRIINSIARVKFCSLYVSFNILEINLYEALIHS